MLARRVRWGSPAEALDIIQVAQQYGVPGFGRQRAVALITQGITTFEEILGTSKEKLLSILRSPDRVKSLIASIASSIGFKTDRYSKAHQRVADRLGLGTIIKNCNEKKDIEYENAIKDLLDAEARWAVTAIDDGKRQNVPDLLVQLEDFAVLIECKTTIKTPPLISKEEAFAVLQKAVDFDKKISRVTLGKPSFDENSKFKAIGATDITLIEHSTFIEGLLRVHAGEVTPKEFLEWLIAPGVSEISRLGGRASYEVVIETKAQ